MFLTEGFVFLWVVASFYGDVDEFTELVGIDLFGYAADGGLVMQMEFIQVVVVVGDDDQTLEESAIGKEDESRHVVEYCSRWL